MAIEPASVRSEKSFPRCQTEQAQKYEKLSKPIGFFDSHRFPVEVLC
jgi:hypothetical protein